MKTLSWKGKLTIAAVIVAIIALIIVGIKYMPLWATFEALITLITGFFGGWMFRAMRLNKEKSNEA